MKNFFRTRIESFGHAFRGLGYAIRNEKNAWIHATATILAIIFAFWLEISLTKWAVLVLTIAMVWSAEMINTSIEAVVDLASPDHHPLAKVGKDVGAAAVLIAAFAALIIGMIIFAPPLWGKITSFFKLT